MLKSNILGRRRSSLFRPAQRSAYVRLRRKSGALVILTALASLVLFFMISGSVLALIAFAVFSRDLPSPDKLTNRKVAVSTKITDRNGKELFAVYRDVNRSIIKLSDLPPVLINATLATEDAEFYQHGGFDITGIARAIRNTIFYHNLQGGSTITQQLVKTTLLTNERSIIRKIKELVLSIQIERIYNKDQILQIYFNEIPYGGTAQGVEAASELYFDKHASELTLAEASLLAGLPQSPTQYSPFGKQPQLARERQRYVLTLMETKGWVTKEGKKEFLPEDQSDAAKKAPLAYAKPGKGINAPHFSLYVKSLLEDRYGADRVESGGLQVKTTLDLDLQQKMEKTVYEEVERVRALKVGNGALVAMNPKTGEILAMVGSKDYYNEENDGNFNVAVDGMRQPGSSIKPFTYAIALSRGLTAATMIMDVPTNFPNGDGTTYSPVNYDGAFRGPISLRTGLGSSINISAVKLLKIDGLENFIASAKSLGITTLTEPKKYGLSLTLGGGAVPLLQMVTAYSALANGGTRVIPTAILEVTDSSGNVIETFHNETGPQAFSPEISYIISNILSDDGARAAAFGRGSLLNIKNYTVAVKTGTSNDKRDNWAIGYTPSMVIGTWVGNNDFSPMDPKLASGITGATPVWNRAMRDYLSGKKDEPFVRPEKIVEADVDSLTGMLPFEGQPTKKEIFIDGTQPKTVSDMYQKIKVCRPDKKIANQGCIDRGDYDEKLFIKLHDPVPEFQAEIDKYINESAGFKDNELYHPPTETSTS